MGQHKRLRSSVEITIEPSLFGNSARGLLHHLGLRGQAIGNDRWLVSVVDDAQLIRSEELAGVNLQNPRFDLLRSLPTDDSIATDEAALASLDNLSHDLSRRFSAGSDETALFHAIQADILRSTSVDLA